MNRQQTATITVELEKFLGYAAAVTRLVGYVSKKSATEKNVPSTAEIAWEWAIRGTRPSTLEKGWLDLKDKELGIKTVAWMRSISTNSTSNGNDYLITLAKIGQSGVVNEKLAGYAASAISAMEKEIAPVSQENFIGTVGEKFSQRLIYTGEFSGFSNFGQYFKYSFTDSAGHEITWMTNKDRESIERDNNFHLFVGKQLTVGQEYLITGKVKKHSTFGRKQTTEISHVKIS